MRKREAQSARKSVKIIFIFMRMLGKAERQTHRQRERETKENNKIKFKIHLRPKQIGSEIGAHYNKKKRGTKNGRGREEKEKAGRQAGKWKMFLACLLSLLRY